MEIVVFTNGCFDLLHQGHIDLLRKARSLGTKLIVGLNSDESVRAIKKSPRPFLGQTARAAILKELRSVDEVRIFDENTPENLIREIKPDVLVKGGDWEIGHIIGADFVLKNGGRVVSIPFENDISSSKIADKIKASEIPAPPLEKREITDRNPVGEILETYSEILERHLKPQISNLVKCAELIFETVSGSGGGSGQVFLCGDLDGVDGENWSLGAQLKRTLGGKSKSLSVIHSEGLNSFRAKLTADAKATESLFGRKENSESKSDLLIAVIAGAENPTVSDDLTNTVMQARRANFSIIGLTALESKKLISVCDAGISIPFSGRLQQKTAHLLIGQIWNQIIEEKAKDSSGF